MRFALTLLLSCLPGVALAAPPNGGYSVSIGGANEIWVPSGDESLCETVGSDTICILTTGAATAATGAVTSTGMIQFHFPGVIDMDLPMTAAGRVSGSTAKPKVKLVVSGTGTADLHDPDFGDVLGAPTTGAGKLVCANPLPHDSVFECAGHLKLCFMIEGHRLCASGRIEAKLGAIGGPLDVTLTLATDGANKITGDASTQIANDAAEAYGVTGKYSPKSDTESLKLVSTTLLSKDKLTFSRASEPLDAGKLTFTIAGQKGSALLVPAP